MRTGLYLDGGAKRARSALQKLRPLGFDHVVLCPSDARGIHWLDREVDGILDAASEIGLGTSVMLWPTSPLTPSSARTLAERVRGWGRIELDLEGSYSGTGAAAWLDALLEALAGVPVDVNTFPARLRHPTTAPAVREVLARGGELHVQAYSVTHPPGQSVPAPYADPVWGPGRAQRRAWRMGTEIAPPERLGLILAGWDQRWPGVSPAQSMREQWEAAVGVGSPTVRWWSSKHLIGRAGGGCLPMPRS